MNFKNYFKFADQKWAPSIKSFHNIFFRFCKITLCCSHYDDEVYCSNVASNANNLKICMKLLVRENHTLVQNDEMFKTSTLSGKTANCPTSIFESKKRCQISEIRVQQIRDFRKYFGDS